MSNRISTKTLKELRKSTSSTTEVVIGSFAEQEVKMTVKKYLTLKEFGRFVADMSEAEFADGDYVPQNGAMIFDITLCRYYTNLNLPENDIVEAYEIIQFLDLVNKIKAVVEYTEQYQTLEKAVEKAQEYTKIQKTGLSGLLVTLQKAINDFDVTKTMEMLKDFDADKLESLGDLRDLAKVLTTPPAPYASTVSGGAIE